MLLSRYETKVSLGAKRSGAEDDAGYGAVLGEGLEELAKIIRGLA